MDFFSEELLQLKNEVMEECGEAFRWIEATAEQNTRKVLESMRRAKVAAYHFNVSTGYAYDDAGRDTLEHVWADVFDAEKALVRTQFVSGTHALATALFGLLRPGDELLSVTGAPYDTMQTVIGYTSKTPGSLKEFGILYNEVALQQNGAADFAKIREAVRPATKVVLIQRSRGYSLERPALSVRQIGEICSFIKEIKKDAVCFVDNCYGEFTDVKEPTQVGADIVAGSLIKNPGGGIAPTGGYIAGREDLVELAAARLTAPGIGGELGASLVSGRLLYQGLFMAPHVTAQALKGAVFAGALFKKLGYTTVPEPFMRRSDIIQAIQLGSAERMKAFARALQSYSPVDSHVTPEPWDMPGYDDPVIMAAGTFVQGASIELSADGPMRAPYAIYLQGALTFEHAVIGIMGAAQAVLETKTCKCE